MSKSVLLVDDDKIICFLTANSIKQSSKVDEVTVKHSGIEALSFLEEIEEIKSKLVEQLYKPVLWTLIVQEMKDSGVEKIIETGPGKVLAGLTRRIDKSLSASAIIDLNSLKLTIEEISNA